MRLNNFSYLLSNIMFRGEPIKPDSEAVNIITGNMIDTSGSAITSFCAKSTNLGAHNMCSDKLFLDVGEGNTKPQPNDYRLENDCASHFSINQTITTGVRESKLIFTINAECTCVVESATINELGLIYYLSPDGVSLKSILIVREVLDEQITLSKGETAVLSMTIEI